MIACSHCGKDVEANEINGGQLLNSDGDFVCDDKCKVAYEKGRDHFFDTIIPDDKKFYSWMGIPDLHHYE